MGDSVNTEQALSAPPEQLAVRCVLMRGGTSKGLYFHEADLPASGPRRDRLLRRAMGTPDGMQIDGLGGSRLVTSKVAIIGRSTRPDTDVDYTFAQLEIERDGIGYDGNCGNISAGVGPFAVDEGLVVATEPVTTVRIFNTNTGKMLRAQVPVAHGKARVTGDCRIAGVPGTGAEILMDYTDTIGARTGKLLPTGNPADRVELEDGSVVQATLCDAGNPCVFVHARDVGLEGNELPTEIMTNQAALTRILEIQSKASVLLGFHDDWRKAVKVGLPLFVLVAQTARYARTSDDQQAADSFDLHARLLFLGKCHDSMAGTGAICTAAASRIRGSVVAQVLSENSRALRQLRIGHPLGVMEITVETEVPGGDVPVRFIALGFGRTARRLMDGCLYVPSADFDSLADEPCGMRSN
ncbi:2-methylaconitate cis-trans isomerase PrpF family protein [Paraburkholderia sp.]|uniref:2-methylaconitate cis-trans isomerase PrpF family protein n=1 Tax=Paraburkholderia sp. TaxID=1926495 RepID=UPI002D3F6D70|nr:PrpF domain-containing protein [Paraburkholderia sp.]HZZ02746.1 PrpF domain-containing protein [Paraburkholderia sp.]